MSETILQKIYQFPVKGFPGQQLPQTTLSVDEGIPNDRRFAVTNGVEDTGSWMSARSFFINAVNDGLPKLKMSFNENGLSVENIEGKQISLTFGDPESLALANDQINAFMQPIGVKEDSPPPRIVERDNKNGNWDYMDASLSIINMETVKAISEVMNVEIDPSRFRGNLVISGLPAWEEFQWMGKRISLGDVELDVHRPIDRCPTPGVNPATGERDIEVTPGIMKHFGHNYCGMYARVVKGGSLEPGNIARLIGDGQISLEDTFVPNANAYPLWPRNAQIVACDRSKAATSISLKATGPWPLPEAKPGQKLRIHLGPDVWTTEYIAGVSEDQYHLEVEPSQTGDPITETVRSDLESGSVIIVSGPFGRV